MARAAIVSTAVVTAVMATAQPSNSAVRMCEDIVTSGVFTDAEELAAKKKALDDWKAKVRPLGEGYTNWVTAGDKMLTCRAGKSGGSECFARGRPCTIQQSPDPNWVPLPRGGDAL